MFSNRLRRFLGRSAIREALWLVLIFAAISTLVWFGTYRLVQREMLRLVDARLTTQMAAVVAARNTGAPLPPAGFGQSIAVELNGQVVAGAAPRQALRTREPGFHDFDSNTENQIDLRYLVQPVEGGRIIVAERVERQEELREVLAGGLEIAVLASIMTTLLAATWMARRSQQRLDRIGTGLAEVAHGNLAARINLPDQGDDLSLLANRIDATTERLAQSVEQMRVQSANIAHDLRTPLARLRALIESRYVALIDKDTPVDADTLEAALAQIDRMAGTFDALLRISRIESGARKTAFDRVDLGQIAGTIEETFGAVVEDAGQRLEIQLTDPAQVRGDPELITQAVANLIQNALRYGRSGQRIGLVVHGHQITITDEGPGIPFAEREKVLVPLYQLAGDRQGAGFGLGLAMVRAVTELHGAALTLADGPRGRGLSVTLRFSKMTEV